MGCKLRKIQGIEFKKQNSEFQTREGCESQFIVQWMSICN